MECTSYSMIFYSKLLVVGYWNHLETINMYNYKFIDLIMITFEKKTNVGI